MGIHPSDNPSFDSGKKLVVTSGLGKAWELLTNSGQCPSTAILITE